MIGLSQAMSDLIDAADNAIKQLQFDEEITSNLFYIELQQSVEAAKRAMGDDYVKDEE